MTTSEFGFPRGALSGAPTLPSPAGIGGSPIPAAAWDLTALAQTMLGALADPNQLVFPAIKAGFTPTLAAAGNSEPAIVANTPGVSPAVLPRPEGGLTPALAAAGPVEPTIASSSGLPLPSPGAPPPPAGAPDPPLDVSLDVCRVPLVSERSIDERAAYIPAPRSSTRDAPTTISLPETQKIAPASPALTRPLRQTTFDPYAVRREFPILNEPANGRRLVWLDNAATTQKPRTVIDRLSYFYAHENSNVHRGAHTLATRATDAYEGARQVVARFLGAGSPQNIVFLRGATEAINLVAQAWGGDFVGAGDEIVITHLEHHANIVPWQQLCAKTGARLRVAPVDDRGDVRLDEYAKLLGPRTKLVSLTQVSNALGTVTPVQQMVALAHAVGARTLVDGAQAVAHFPVDVQALDTDFYVFSGHKVYAPTGIGVLYGKSDALEQTPPWQGGGNMIRDVTFERTTYHGPAARFEAGTGNIADAVGLGAALEWLQEIGHPQAAAYEHDLLTYATQELSQVSGLRIIGTAPNKAGVISFVLGGRKTEEMGAALDREGIAVRSGHHCAQPILRRFGLEATVRASLAPYNTREDIDTLVAALRHS